MSRFEAENIEGLSRYICGMSESIGHFCAKIGTWIPF